MFDKLTVVWASLSAFLTAGLALIVNYAVEPRWVAPLSTLLCLLALIAYGRIPRRRRKQ